VQLGEQIAIRRSCSGGPEHLLQAPQRALIAIDELDLDLMEAFDDALPLEDSDRVGHDLGAVDANALSLGSQTRDGADVSLAEVGNEKRQHRLGRASRRPCLLELQSRGPLWQLELPEPCAVLDAVPERDAVPRKHVVRSVVVGRDEGSLGKPLAAQLGQLEPLGRRQLDLALKGLFHHDERTARRPQAALEPGHLFTCISIRLTCPTVRLALTPRTSEFYDLFAKAGANALEVARLVDRRFKEYPNSSVTQEQVKAAETAGDSITRDLIQLLNTQYLTPFDREDIYLLATELDDVVDYLEEASDLLGLYGVELPTRHARQQCELIVLAVVQLAAALDDLKGMRHTQAALVELKRLEDEGDKVLRDALASLFRDDRIDPLIVIRWKDIYEALERALDACETAANVVANILVKNS
jgi:uncharacterized protein